jgi:exonuclease III
MDVTRYLQILLSSWNVRGLNDPDKCLDVKMNLSAQPLHIICLQETKLSAITPQKAMTFLPLGFSAFFFLPSVGASGGIITAWDPRQVTHLSDR